MISLDGKRILCDETPCPKTIKNHRWGKIKEGEKWWFSRDNEVAFCPDHLPDWVRKQRGLE